MTAEAGATLLCSSAAGQLFLGTATGAQQEVAFEVPAGSHTVSCIAKDGAGNVSTPYTIPVSYTAPKKPTIRQVTASSSPLELSVTGPAGGTATVKLSNGELKSTAFGTAISVTVSFDVPDGDYDVEAVVSDRRGTPSPTARRSVVVDTAAPKLALNVKKGAARGGTLEFQVKTEKGANVVVTTKGTRLKAHYTAKSKPRSFERDVDEGTYTVTVSATDGAGNTTTRKATVKIA